MKEKVKYECMLEKSLNVESHLTFNKYLLLNK